MLSLGLADVIEITDVREIRTHILKVRSVKNCLFDKYQLLYSLHFRLSNFLHIYFDGNIFVVSTENLQLLLVSLKAYEAGVIVGTLIDILDLVIEYGFCLLFLEALIEVLLKYIVVRYFFQKTQDLVLGR